MWINNYLILSVLTSAMLVAQTSSEDVDTSPESNKLWTGIGIATGLDNANRPSALQQYSLSLWGYSKRQQAIRYTLTYIHSPIPEEISSNDFSSQNGLTIIDVALDAKHFYSEDLIWQNQYFSYGIGLAIAFWKYSDSFSDKELAGSLSVAGGIDVRLGQGIVLGHINTFNTTIDISPGVIFWLSNDNELSTRHRVPPPYLYISARVGFNYSFFSWK